MMKRTLLTAVASLIVSFAISGPAHAVMIAGWDFSQYFSSGELYTAQPGEEEGYHNTLGANYSNLLLAPGAGPAAAVHGTLFFDGQYGSTDVVPDSPTAQLTPASGSLSQNLNAPQTSAPFVPFNSFTTLDAAGQGFEEDLNLQIRSTVSFVFAAYLDTIPGLVSDWSISFGGRTLGGTALIDVFYSTNGIDFASAGQRTLSTTAALFSINLAGLPSDTAYVRFAVNTTGAVDTQIDNVSISGTVTPVPLPSVSILLGTALAAFALVGRRRA